MFKKVTESLEKAAVRSKLKEGKLFCPDCGAKAGDLPARWEDAMECRECGAKASLLEWADSGDKTLLRTARSDVPPPGTRIRVSDDGNGGTVWEIPRNGKFGFFLFFGLFWLGITGFVSGGFLVSGGIDGDFPNWVLIPFFGIFWAIGLGMLWVGFRNMLAKHRLAVGGGIFSFERNMLGMSKLKTLACTGIKTVERKEFLQAELSTSIWD